MPDSAGDEQDASRDDSLASYTPQQHRAIIKGLRILARVAIRSYMKERAEQAPSNEEGGGDEGK